MCTTFSAQQRNLQRLFRVLKPGGVSLGSDSLASNGLHHFHEADDYKTRCRPALFSFVDKRLGLLRGATIVVDGNVNSSRESPTRQ